MLMNSALFMATWSLTGSGELSWLGYLEMCFPFSIFFFSCFIFILLMAQIIRFRWPGRAVGIVATMKPSLLIRVAGGGGFPCCHQISVGWSQQEAVGGNATWDWSQFLSYWTQAGNWLHEKQWGTFRALPSPFHQCHIQCWACCEKDWTDLVIKTECPLK